MCIEVINVEKSQCDSNLCVVHLVIDFFEVKLEIYDE